jgi:hypothetical protein
VRSIGIPEALPPETGSSQPVPIDEKPSNERPKQDPEWQRLQTIYRKHQEPTDTPSVSGPSGTISQTGSVETTIPNETPENDAPTFKQHTLQGLRSIFRKRQEPNQEKTANPVDPVAPALAPSESDPPQALDPANRSVTIDKSSLRSLPVQRSMANRPSRAESNEPKSMEKNMSPLSSSTPSMPTVEVEASDIQPYGKSPNHDPENPDQVITGHLHHPVPLESAWQVQRVETPATHAEEPIASQGHGTLPHAESDLSGDSDQFGEPDVVAEPFSFSETEKRTPETVNLQPFTDSSKGPVEILAPSRPRPFPASVMPSKPVVQRQPENRDSLRHSDESSLVSTAIGPLPSDLWSLLGQKPPTAGDPMKAHDEPTMNFSQTAITGPQKMLPSRLGSTPDVKSANSVDMPAMLQRQTLTNAPGLSMTQEQGQAQQNKDKSKTEPDLDDLAQKVYVEVRRRLALERERTRRNI